MPFALQVVAAILGYTTELMLPAGTWRGSENAPGLTRRLSIQSGIDDAGTGAYVWHAGIVLTEWLGQRPELVKGKAILELGAGTGAVSIFAAGLGASRVMATDGGKSSILELAASNVKLNRQAFPDASVRVLPLQWGDELPEAVRALSWDIILGSDVTYNPKAHAPLCDTIAAVRKVCCDELRPPRVLLAHLHRLGDPPVETFCELARSRGLQSRVLAHIDRPQIGEAESVRVSILEL